jgi:hypothetical protein
VRDVFNDVLRRLIGFSLVALGVVLEGVQRFRLATHGVSRARLAARLGVNADTPIRAYGPEVERSIAVTAATMREAVSYARTSGSTAAPKHLLYTPRRVARLKWYFTDAFVRGFARAPSGRQSLYAFSSLRSDDSLTAMMTAERGTPSYLATLQAPYRIHAHPALEALAARYDDAAVRLWVLTLANPGVLYSTNPSTLAAFLDALVGDWDRTRALVADVVLRPHTVPDAVHALARRLTSRGARERMKRIAAATEPLTFAELVPGVDAYVCWTGGYVEPFLRRVESHLPANRYRLIPMYSMSTETPQTTPCYRGDRVAFVPLAPDVLYEFLPEGATDDDVHRLVAPDALAVGQRYTMVVSDTYGLTRYQTDDLFECVGHVGQLPDLRFVRRRSLSYSFTGEKLTGAQLQLAFDRARMEFGLGHDVFLTCIPSSPRDGSLPHYRLIHVARSEGEREIRTSMDAVAAFCDHTLGVINPEYATKRASRRLGALRGARIDRDEFLTRAGADPKGTWEAQFKFLPLVTRPWQNADVTITGDSR